MSKVLVIIALCYVLFLSGLGSIALWDPDEPRQAIMAREMMDRNDFIHPYLNGAPYLEKPPFFPWMIAAAARMTGGVNELSSRIPAALSASLLVLAVFFLGRRLVDPVAGLLSAFVLAVNYQFLSNAREAVMDMTFAFFIGLTILLNYLAAEKGNRLYFLLSFLPAALGVLTKGPAALVIPAGTAFFYLISKEQLKRFFLPLVAGCFLAAAGAAIWFLLAGEAYWKEFILHQNITRYTHAFDHAESFLYYFHKLFFNFMPWSILLPFALVHGVRRKAWLPVSWFLFTFLFFEMSTSKRAIYLLSCYPACALLVGIFLKDCWSWILAKTSTNWIVRLFAVVFGLLPVAACVIITVVPASSLGAAAFFKGALATLYVFSAALFFAAILFFYYAAKGRQRGSLTCLFLYLVTVGVLYHVLYMPVMDQALKSPRLITDKVGDLKKGRELYSYGFNSPGVIFYLGQHVNTITSLTQIKSDKRDILLIVEDRPARALRADLERGFSPVGTARYEKDHYTFYVRKDGA